ncbi:MAG: helix-turn-helix domain-containing protein [Gemmatimonadetes bacterium]|nr:helix-turn-helix domain-containing protein [Gemmatimonadota bacterium]
MTCAPRDLLLLEGEFPEFPGDLERYAVRPLPGWAALRERVRSAAPRSIVLLRAGGGERDADAVRELIRDTPSVPVVAAVPFARASAAQLRELLHAGVSEIANADGRATLPALLPSLRQAHARPLKRRLEERMPVWVPEDARTLIRAAAETVVDGGGREAFAAIFGVYVRTVAARCTEAGLPPPRRLLGWIRVLLAISLLEEAHRTVLNVALACGYTDNSSLKRAVENFAGPAAPIAVRQHTFAGAFDAFAAELRRLRHAGRGRGRSARVME